VRPVERRTKNNEGGGGNRQILQRLTLHETGATSGHPTSGLMGAIGPCDAVGLDALAHGLQLAPAWLVGLVNSTSPVFVTLIALLVFGERLRSSQWAGVGLVALSILAVIGDKG
jgi:drug/metabolite transporter (DMT)-like permease